MTLELVGSIAIEFPAGWAIRSASGAQVVPPFVVFHTPPATPAAYIVVGVVGSIRIARVRPPMLPGPSWVHAPREAAALMARSIWLRGGRGAPRAGGCWGVCWMCSGAGG